MADATRPSSGGAAAPPTAEEEVVETTIYFVNCAAEHTALLAIAEEPGRRGGLDITLENHKAKEVALAPQRPALLPWLTVRANAALLTKVNRRQGSTLTRTEIDDLLDEVGIGEFAAAYPNQLSGGMQQRVSLIRTFATGAPVLLMDEPFAALDELTRADMRYLLTRVWERHQATVVFVTHAIFYVPTKIFGGVH